MNEHPPYHQYAAAQDAKFSALMAKVDATIIAKTGLRADDLPDFCYRDAFDDGASSVQAARQAIKAAKEDF